MALPSKFIGSSIDPPATCPTKMMMISMCATTMVMMNQAFKRGRRGIPSIDSRLLKPSYSPEGEQPAHQAPDTSTTFTPNDTSTTRDADVTEPFKADVTSSSHAHEEGWGS